MCVRVWLDVCERRICVSLFLQHVSFMLQNRRCLTQETDHPRECVDACSLLFKHISSIILICIEDCVCTLITHCGHLSTPYPTPGPVHLKILWKPTASKYHNGGVRTPAIDHKKPAAHKNCWSIFPRFTQDNSESYNNSFSLRNWSAIILNLSKKSLSMLILFLWHL